MSGRSRRPCPLPFAGVAIVALLVGCSGGEPTPQLPLPPEPDLSSAEGPVRLQYELRRAAVDEAMARRASSPEIGTALGRLGQWYQIYLFRESAEVAYRGARQLDPTNARWPYYAAHLARDRGDVDAASALFRRVVELEPGYLAATVWLAEIDWEAGRTTEAARGFDEALIRDPECVQALVGRGKIAVFQDNPDLGMRLLEKALTIQPNATGLRYQLGLAYRLGGHTPRARSMIEQTPFRDQAHVRPNLTDPWMEELEAARRGGNRDQARGQAAMAAGRYREAADYFRSATESRPESTEAWVNLANALERGGNLKAALRAAENAVSNDPSYARARMVLAGVLIRLRRFDEARSQLEASVASDPAHAPSHFNLGQLRVRSGDLSGALTNFAAVRRLDSRHVSAAHAHAAVLLRLKRSEAALAGLEEDLAKMPGEPRLLNLVARILAAAPDPTLRDGTRAVSMALEIGAGGWTIATAETLAMALAEVQRFTEAAEWQAAVVETAKDFDRPAIPQRARERLSLYLQGLPCREPWQQTELESLAPLANIPPSPA